MKLTYVFQVSSMFSIEKFMNAIIIFFFFCSGSLRRFRMQRMDYGWKEKHSYFYSNHAVQCEK